MIERDRNLDHGWAWMISISCAIINGLTFGLIRSSGIFFYHLRNDLKISRKTASWPFALCTTAAYLSGPITGILVNHYPFRKVVLVGVGLTSLGFFISSLHYDILYINLGIGIVFGLGVAFSFMQTPVILAQYFNKYLATANSISQAGGTVGSFIFPPLLEFFISNYGMRGAFLLSSAILLNGLSCGLLLRPPNPSDQPHDEHKEESPVKNPLIEHIPLEMIENTTKNESFSARRRTKELFHLRKNSLEIFSALDHKTKNQITLLDPYQNIPQAIILKELLSNERLLNHQKQIRFMFKHFYETKHLLNNICQKNEKNVNIVKDLKELELFITNDEQTENGKQHHQSRYVQTLPFNKPKIWFDSIKTIVSNPMYLILLTTHVSFQWTWMTYQMIIYDFAVDQNMTSSQSVSLLTFFALSDLFGRFVSGWIADRKLMKKNHVVSICILCIGFLIQITSHYVTFEAQLLLANLLGFFCGVIIVLFNILSMEYVGLDHFPDALGISAFFVGITSLARPFIIGLFRDVFGSYWGLFQFAGVLSFLSAFLWLMEPFAILSYKRSQAKTII